jgi:hypothetical protein
MTANLAPQLPADGGGSGASSARGDACSDVAQPSPRAASITGRIRSFFTGDEDRSRFWERFGQTAMAAAYH